MQLLKEMMIGLVLFLWSGVATAQSPYVFAWAARSPVTAM